MQGALQHLQERDGPLVKADAFLRRVLGCGLFGWCGRAGRIFGDGLPQAGNGVRELRHGEDAFALAAALAERFEHVLGVFLEGDEVGAGGGFEDDQHGGSPWFVTC